MFTIHTLHSAPEASQDALRGLERNIGFIPNLAAAIAGSPTAIGAFVGLQTSLRGSTLTGLEREVVGITVSRHNDCEYSLAAHATFARAHGADDETVAALLAGEPLPDPRLEALHAFTGELLERRGHVDADGISPEQALEVITQVAYTTLANFAADTTKAPIDDAFVALTQG
jgi:AhpD family alkylhydroperoxidase